MAVKVTIADEYDQQHTTDNPLFVTLPLDLMTGNDTHPTRRIRTDNGQQGFYDGREFRTYYEFTANTVFKIVVPINTILWNLSLILIEGECRMETVVGGTEGGVFTPITIFGRNNMTERPEPFYTN